MITAREAHAGNLARSLDEQHPGAARSLGEGLEDLLTVKDLGLGGSKLERTLSTTNLIENLIGQVRQLSGRVKRWRSGKMILRGAPPECWKPSVASVVSGVTRIWALITALQKHEAKLNRSVSDSAVAVA